MIDGDRSAITECVACAYVLIHDKIVVFLNSRPFFVYC